MIWIVTNVRISYNSGTVYATDINCEACDIHYDEFYNAISWN